MFASIISLVSSSPKLRGHDTLTHSLLEAKNWAIIYTVSILLYVWPRATVDTPTMASQHRKTTIYDITSLRVHPSGRRVKPPRSETASSTPTSTSAKGKSKGKARYWGDRATRDIAGNQIAADALGKIEFSRYIPASARGSSEGNEEQQEQEDEDGRYEDDVSVEEDEDVNEGTKKRKGKEKAQDDSTSSKTKRPKKKAKFLQDYSYIRSSPSTSYPETPRSSSSRTPLPSPVRHLSSPLSLSTRELLLLGVVHRTQKSNELQELLKSIHHFASIQFEERGLLLNIAQQHRKRLKRRALLKSKGTGKGRAKQSSVDAEDPDEDDEEPGGDEEDEESEVDDFNVIPSNVEDLGSSSFRGPGRPKRAVQYRDLYRAFDGSALMALGEWHPSRCFPNLCDINEAE